MNKYDQLLSRAAKLCSSGEKCQHDVSLKLEQWGMKPDDIDRAIKYLVENKFIDDERFARFFARDKLAFNKWGRVKITYALRQKKVSADIISKSMESIDEEKYIEILDELLRAKIRSTGPLDDPKNKAKVLRFAAQRGFTSEEIFASMGRVL